MGKLVSTVLSAVTFFLQSFLWMKYSVKNEDPGRLDGWGGGLPKRVNIKAEERSGWGRKGSESENKSKTNL